MDSNADFPAFERAFSDYPAESRGNRAESFRIWKENNLEAVPAFVAVALRVFNVRRRKPQPLPEALALIVRGNKTARFLYEIAAHKNAGNELFPEYPASFPVGGKDSFEVWAVSIWNGVALAVGKTPSPCPFV